MATSFKYKNLYNKKNMSRIKYLAKNIARIKNFTKKEKEAFNFNYVSISYYIYGHDLMGFDVEFLPLDCYFLKENCLYEVYEFKSKFFNSRNKSEGDFLIILKDTETNVYHSLILKIRYKKIKVAKQFFKNTQIVKIDYLGPIYKKLNKYFCDRPKVTELKLNKTKPFDQWHIREKAYKLYYKR